MHKRYFVAVYRICFGLLGLLAIVVQFFHGAARDNFSPVNFLSFFTVESNILAVIVFLVGGFALERARRKRGSDAAIAAVAGNWALVRGAVVLYMARTGIVYVTLLAGLEESLQTAIPWVNLVLHYIMPIAVVIDWFISPPLRRIPFGRALVWGVFPLAYVAYNLVRGSIVSWYPYPFLNPLEHGYALVIAMCLVIALGVLALTALLSASTRWLDLRALNVGVVTSGNFSRRKKPRR